MQFARGLRSGSTPACTAFGPRVIPAYAFSAPYEDLRLKGR
jgi:hypothetical protein